MALKTVFLSSEKATVEVKLGYIGSKSTMITTAPAIILAHPYGPLGGSTHNNVIIALQKGLLAEGYITASFNFRGCGQSTGKTSWTGLPEQNDYQTVVNYILRSEDFKKEYPTVSHLVICGYSYGGMIASAIRESAIPTSYILISYPLRVIWALATTKTSYFKSKVSQLLQSPASSALEPVFSEPPNVYIVYGGKDQFTSRGSYKSWIDTVTSDRVQHCLVQNADHFWMDMETELLGHIREWLSSTIDHQQ